MRKIAIVFCLLGLLIGTTFVGQAIAQSPNPEHGFIAITPHHGATGTVVTVSGKGWQSGVEVEIYVDTTLVSSVIPDSGGEFVRTISMSAASLGHHEIIVVQDGLVAANNSRSKGLLSNTQYI
jgi:hypothetical protein